MGKRASDSESQSPTLESECLEDLVNNALEEDKTLQSSSHQTQQKQYDNQYDEDFNPLRDVLGESFYEDEDSSEDEGMPDYKIGGYHPIHVGEILLDRYVIIQKLGWGHFSTVWLTKDLKYNSYVALKVQKSAQHYVEAAYDEVDILDQIAQNWKTDEWKRSVEEYYKNDKWLTHRKDKYGVTSESSHCAQLLNSFIHHGPNGKHFIMVFEILGVNFLEIIKRYDYKGVPLPLVRRLARQCLIGLDYMHRMCQMIHTDFKPENVVICLRDEEVEEIRKTGQLTTTKMGKNDHIKEMNMKVAGTLPPKKKAEAAKDSPSKTADTVSECQSSNTASEVWDPKLFVGLSAKQKKNLRKKLQRRRRRGAAGASQADSSIDVLASQKGDSEIPEGEIGDLDIDIAGGDDSTAKADAEESKTSAAKEESKHASDRSDDDEEEESKEEAKSVEDVDAILKVFGKRGRKLDEKVLVKICDMGNGCWTYHHFTPEIQTRQYRSPEVIIGADYNTSADVWSFACTIFEMVTGDFLFEPRKGANYDKDDDHLAQMMELLGRMPKNLALSGKHSKKFFTSSGHLRRISGLNYWPLKKVLVEKYRIREEEAYALADFLLPMLTWSHESRASAKQVLEHPWFNMLDNYDFKYSDREYDVMMLKKDLKNQMKSGPGDRNDDPL
jgi:serine/threonine-protein kinase SRPK3